MQIKVKLQVNKQQQKEYYRNIIHCIYSGMIQTYHNLLLLQDFFFAFLTIKHQSTTQLTMHWNWPHECLIHCQTRQTQYCSGKCTLILQPKSIKYELSVNRRLIRMFQLSDIETVYQNSLGGKHWSKSESILYPRPK